MASIQPTIGAGRKIRIGIGISLGLIMTLIASAIWMPPMIISLLRISGLSMSIYGFYCLGTAAGILSGYGEVLGKTIVISTFVSSIFLLAEMGLDMVFGGGDGGLVAALLWTYFIVPGIAIGGAIGAYSWLKMWTPFCALGAYRGISLEAASLGLVDYGNFDPTFARWALDSSGHLSFALAFVGTLTGLLIDVSIGSTINLWRAKNNPGSNLIQ